MADKQRLISYYQALGTDALMQAYAVGAAAYEPDAWEVIVAEIAARGLSSDLPANPAPLGSEAPRSGGENEPLTREELDVELRLARRQSRNGLLYILGGLGVTIGTFAIATEGRGGGTYVVAWGAVVCGVVQVVRANAREDRANRLLTRLTTSGAEPRS